jgi:predicted  nucleic acid-binding Zn-ribbon protein
MLPLNKRITEREREVASATERIKEIEAMIADPAHYKDSQNVVAVNREYLALRKRVAELTAEWDDLTAEAEQLKREYHRAQEDLESERFGE